MNQLWKEIQLILSIDFLIKCLKNSMSVVVGMLVGMGMGIGMGMGMWNVIVIVIGTLLYLRNFICFLLNVGCRWELGWNSGGRVGRGQGDR